jgi:putative CRISPR-associated protein (TIGR02619 family)
MSAELNSLIKYKKGDFNPSDYYVLLCTDTYLGEITANIIKSWLEKKGCSVLLYRQKDLQTAELIPFKLALSDLVKFVEEIVLEFKNKGYKIIFNLTGGFKSVQGFLQVLAMFYADKALYIFESGNELLEIPRLPVELKKIDVVKNHLISFRKLSFGNFSPQHIEDIEKIPETFLLQLDGKVGLSPWGEIVWHRAKREIYQEKIWPPPLDNIIFEKDFFKNFEKLVGKDTARMREFNERIDDLCLFLLEKKGLRRLRFKELKANPKPPYTHEFYPFTGKALRCFCRFEEDKLIISLDEHLS